MSQPEMIVALDVPNGEAMRSTLASMPDSIGWYKVGLELFCSEGPSVWHRFRIRINRSFLI